MDTRRKNIDIGTNTQVGITGSRMTIPNQTRNLGKATQKLRRCLNNNARSLGNKREELNLLMQEVKPDIGIMETWV